MAKERAKGDIGVGYPIDATAQRDAIHIAVLPVVAGDVLYPGQKVGVTRDQDGRWIATPSEAFLGIVDPFLQHPVYPDTWVYMFMFPGSIETLRHEWTHPYVPVRKPQEMSKEIVEAVDKVASVKWIEEFANKVGLSYKALMDAARDWLQYEDYHTFSFDEHGESFEMEFWEHYEKVTGIEVREDQKENFFSCSC